MKSFPDGATIYISGPMTGLPDLNRDAFETAENFLRLWGFEPINPLKIHPPERTALMWLSPDHHGLATDERCFCQ